MRFALSSFLLVGTLVATSPSYAATGTTTSLADQWIALLFGDTASTGTSGLSLISTSLQQMLTIYGYSMLAVAGIILFYHLARMIVDTAHQGVIFGRSTNQVWAPLRLIAAIILLVPIGQGLSSGQYMVIKIAQEGSRLADRAWTSFATLVGAHAFTPTQPAPPSHVTIAAQALDMELCRMAYNHTLAATKDDTLIKTAGIIPDLQKRAATTTTPETWVYTNTLNSHEALCGAYTFDGLRQRSLIVKNEPSNITPLVASLSTAAKSDMDNLAAQARSAAQRAFGIIAGTPAAYTINLQSDVTQLAQTLSAQHQKSLNNGTMVAVQTTINNQLTNFLSMGWVGAGASFFQAASAQLLLQNISDMAIPRQEPPILSYPYLGQLALRHYENSSIPARPEPMLAMRTLYANSSSLSHQSHTWIMADAEAGALPLTVPTFEATELAQRISSPEHTLAIALRATDSVATSLQLWGRDTSSITAQTLALDPTSPTNIFARLIIFAGQEMKLAQWMASYAAAGSTNLSQTLAYAPLLLIALLLGAGACATLYLVPLIPMLRYSGSILGWLLLLLEAIITMPLIAIAHLTPSGEGISGGTAKNAYYLWLLLFVRPISTLLAFMGSVLIFLCGLTLLSMTLDLTADISARAVTSASIGFQIFILLAFNLGVLILANLCFRSPHDIPLILLRWISGQESSHITPPSASVAGNAPLPPDQGAPRGLGASPASPMLTASTGTATQGHSPPTAHHATAMHFTSTDREPPPLPLAHSSPHSATTPQAVADNRVDPQTYGSSSPNAPTPPTTQAASKPAQSSQQANRGFFPNKD